MVEHKFVPMTVGDLKRELSKYPDGTQLWEYDASDMTEYPYHPYGYYVYPNEEPNIPPYHEDVGEGPKQISPTEIWTEEVPVGPLKKILVI